MTRQESQKLTKEKMRTAKSGKEIADAIIAHFRNYVPAVQEARVELDTAGAKSVLDSTALF